MALKLVVSPDSSWCTERISALVKWTGSSLPRKDLLWLVPSWRVGEALRERFLQQSGNTARGVFLPDIKVFSAWPGEVYRRMGDGKALIEDRAREIIIQHLVEVSPSSYLKKESRYPGILAKISKFVVSTRRNGFSMDEIRDRICKFNLRRGEREKLLEKDKFMLGILEEYQKFLHEKVSMDCEDTIGWLTDALLKEKPNVTEYFSRYKTLILDGFYYLAPSQRKLVKALTKGVSETILSVHAEPGIMDGVVDDDCPIPDSYLSFIREMVKYCSTRWEVEKMSSAPLNLPSIFFDDPVDRVEEVRKIARGVKATLLDNPEIPPDRIAVVFPSLDLYAPLIHEIFPQYAFPYRLKFRLSTCPLAQAFKKMLDLRCNGFLREDIEDFFSYGFIRFNPQLTSEERVEFFHSLKLHKPGDSIPAFDYFSFNELYRKANISGGSDFLNDWLEPIRKYLLSEACREPKEFKSAQYLERVGDTLFYLKQLHQLLWRLPDTLTSADFQNTIEEFAGVLQIPENLLSSSGQQNAWKSERVIRQERVTRTEAVKRDMAAFSKIMETLAEMTNCFRFLDRPDRKYPLTELRRQFLRHMAQSEFSRPEQKGNILVMNLSETMGLTFDTVFMGGLVEGELPLVRERDIFYPAGKSGIFERPDNSQESRFLFSGLLKNGGRRIYLFAPGATDEKILFPSSLVNSDWKRFPDSEAVYSRQDLLKQIASTWNDFGQEPDIAGILRKYDPDAFEQAEKILKMEEMRSCLSLSHYEGVLNNTENLIRLRERFTSIPQNPYYYSVSQLDTYARCPIQYFFAYILGLKTLPQITEEIETDTRGILIHKILEEYYGDISEEGMADQEFLRKKLLETAHRVFDNWAPPFYNAFWEEEKRKLFSGLDGNGEEKPGILLRFWKNEQKQLQYSRPLLLEFSFGCRENSENDFCINDIRLTGRIDRVDSLLEYPCFLFFDYKTGKIPGLNDIAKGLSFQIPVYLMALEEYFQKRGMQWTQGAGGYYAISDREVKIKDFYGESQVENYLHSRSRQSRFFSKSDLNEESQKVRDRIHRIDRAVKEGKFHPPLADKRDVPCTWCDFKKICRYDSDKMAQIRSDGENRDLYLCSLLNKDY